MTESDKNAARKSALLAIVFGTALLAIAFAASLASQSPLAGSPGNGTPPTLLEYYVQAALISGIAVIIAGVAAIFFPAFPKLASRAIFDLRPMRFDIVVAAASLTVALFVQFALFDNIPHVTDAISHDFQARLLAQGRFYAPRPPCVDAFFQHHFIMTLDGKWFSKYTPGHPVLLMLGYLFHAQLLVVPLCHALTPALLRRIVTRFYEENTARIAAVLFATSPLAILLSASFMSHTTFLFMATAGTWSLVQTHDRSHSSSRIYKAGWGSLAGLCWGWALIIRPQDAAICGLMVVSACLIQGRTALTALLLTGIKSIPGLIPPILLYLLWNHEQYGVLLTVGYGFNQDLVINRVYQASFGLSDNFTLRDAFRLMAHTAYRFDRASLGWPTTALFCLPCLMRRLDRRDAACAAAIALHMAVYFFYDYYGLEYEARYYFNLLPMAVVLVARSIITLPPLLNRTGLLVAFAFTVHSVAHFWPAVVVKAYGRDYEQSSNVLHRDALAAGITNAVVLIDSTGDEEFRYSSGMIKNDPLLASNIVYARNLGTASTECLQANFPDRTFFEASRSPERLHFTFLPLPRNTGPKSTEAVLENTP